MIKGYYDVIKCKLNIPTIQSKLQMKEITPSTEEQYIIPDEGYDGLTSAIVKAVTNEIDPNILPENIRLGKNILGIDGNLEPDKPDQNKTITPTTEEQIVRADAGYELASVKVKAVSLQSKNITINQNGTTTVTPDTGYDGLSDVDVTVEGVLDTSDATAIASDMAQNTTAYVNGQKVTGTLPTIGSQTIDGANYSINSQNLNMWGYITRQKAIINSGSSMFLSTAVRNIANTAGLTPEKLKKGEVVLGVTGSYEGEKIILPNGTKFGNSNKCSDFDWLEHVDCSNITELNNAFSSSQMIKFPNMNLGKVTTMMYMCQYCGYLEDVPYIDTTNCLDLQQAFERCPRLTNESLNNILLMGLNSKWNYKTLRLLGLSQEQAKICTTLSNWQACVAAGWRTGY